MPMIGDIRSNTQSCGRLDEVVDFDIWVGDRWVPAHEAKDLKFTIEWSEPNDPTNFNPQGT